MSTDFLPDQFPDHVCWQFVLHICQQIDVPHVPEVPKRCTRSTTSTRSAGISISLVATIRITYIDVRMTFANKLLQCARTLSEFVLHFCQQIDVPVGTEKK